MTAPQTFRISSLAALILLSACGGGEDSSHRMVTQMAFDENKFDDEHARLEMRDEEFGATVGLQRAQSLAVGTRAAVNMPTMGTTPTATKAAAKKGHWSAPFDTGMIAIHLNVLSDGSLMYFGGEAGAQKYDGTTLKFATLRPGETFQNYPEAFSVASFCAGNISLPDGGVLITGGTSKFGGDEDDVNAPNFSGASLLAKYLPGTNTVGGLGSGLAYKRWYPTNVMMPDNKVAVLGGKDENGLEVGPAEVVDTQTGATRVLSDVDLRPLGFSYPRAVAVDNNRIVVLSRGSGAPYLLDIRGKGSLTALPKSPNLPNGPLASLGNGKFLVAGSYGGRDGVTTSKVIEVSAAGLTVSNTAEMASARTYHELTTLPDGSVVATGGATSKGQATFHLNAELWVNGSWSTLAQAALNRGYHSTAVLLQDGTVAKLGSTRPQQTQGEIFYPPYLFNADGTPRTRPVINSVSRLSSGGRSDIELVMSNANAIKSVSLIRLGATTHQTPMSGLYHAAAFTQNGRKLTVTVSQNSSRVPAGRYWVFALDQSGTPSIAKMVTVE